MSDQTRRDLAEAPIFPWAEIYIGAWALIYAGKNDES